MPTEKQNTAWLIVVTILALVSVIIGSIALWYAETQVQKKSDTLDPDTINARDITTTKLTAGSKLSVSSGDGLTAEVGDASFNFPLFIGKPGQILAVSDQTNQLEFVDVKEVQNAIEKPETAEVRGIAVFSKADGSALVSTQVEISPTGNLTGLTSINGVVTTDILAKVDGALPMDGTGEMQGDLNLNEHAIVGVSTLNDVVLSSTVGALSVSSGLSTPPTSASVVFSPTLPTSQNTMSVSVGAGAGTTTQGNGCVAVGASAGNSNQQGSAVAIGQNAGKVNQASGAICIGYNCSPLGTLAGSICIGSGVSTESVTGGSDVIIGNNACKAGAFYNSVVLGTGACQLSVGNVSDVIAIGKQTCESVTQSCIGIGNAAGRTQGLYSIALGYQSGDTQGTNCASIGYAAGAKATGNYLVSIGSYANRTATNDNAISIGYSAGGGSSANLDVGLGSVQIGRNACTKGSHESQVAIGYLSSDFDGGQVGSVSLGARTGNSQYGVVIGYNASYGIEQGQSTICIGSAAMSQYSSGPRCIAIGYGAGKGMSGLTANSTCIGYEACAGTVGNQALVIGHGAGTGTVGANTVVLGFAAECVPTDGISIGHGAKVIQEAPYGIAIGSGSQASGNDDVIIGKNARGGNTFGRNIVIGGQADSVDFAQCIVIGAEAKATSTNQFVLASANVPINLSDTAVAGAGQAVPATIEKYLPVLLNGVQYKLALFK